MTLELDFKRKYKLFNLSIVLKHICFYYSLYCGCQEFIYDVSWGSTDQYNGFWIGLTSESGEWRWVDGRNLTGNE